MRDMPRLGAQLMSIFTLWAFEEAGGLPPVLSVLDPSHGFKNWSLMVLSMSGGC